jgi:hypothetical protein
MISGRKAETTVKSNDPINTGRQMTANTSQGLSDVVCLFVVSAFLKQVTSYEFPASS